MFSGCSAAVSHRWDGGSSAMESLSRTTLLRLLPPLHTRIPQNALQCPVNPPPSYFPELIFFPFFFNLFIYFILMEEVHHQRHTSWGLMSSCVSVSATQLLPGWIIGRCAEQMCQCKGESHGCSERCIFKGRPGRISRAPVSRNRVYSP